MKKAVTLAALALATTALTAMAGEGGGRGDHFRKADTNGDGMISRAEAAAMPRLAKHFDEIDTNKDGQLSPDELRAFHEKMRAEHWKRIDTNGDGFISKAEAQANAPRLFERFDQLDLNKDGLLSKEELQAARGAHGRK
jgi:Ca2+-binding EF-hand superfamily protein